MESQHQSKDQAESLRTYKEEGGFKEGMDVLDLPPRSEVHQQRTKKTKWKISSMWIRFLFLWFVIIAAILLSFPYWDRWFGSSENPSIIEEHPLHEQVTVDN
ncbi:hypothetical protein H0266_02900 [Halobacillus locisalis]|uniref:Uncharacterized protein n=1 Tax=Halobacillus locisalis TaxID=220753 RepID=A0A838CPB9_9BACI|nr:hypothetical protein [Halobacillus locisalis]MBA2173840.1 hypothetical protein [Halobacillus locisalis]